jgi:hypothetical protein
MEIIKTFKESKLIYYLTNIFQAILPKFIYQSQLKKWLSYRNEYPIAQINERLNYYISINKHALDENLTIQIGAIKKPRKGSVYFFDLIKVTRYFNHKYKIAYKFGDITEVQSTPTFVKSRPINHNNLSVLLKLNEVRHFKFINDSTPFSEKKDMAVWRGVVHKENRELLVDQYYLHPKCDIGQVGKLNLNPIWEKPFLSINEQLKYKFILSIEGNDVATNLKWIMSSNSLCFMPTPKFETWYMEGKLIPNFHYVHIEDDYSDLIDKIDYYSSNENEALEIIKNANEWITQFTDPKLEQLLSILVMEKYLQATEQR